MMGGVEIVCPKVGIASMHTMASKTPARGKRVSIGMQREHAVLHPRIANPLNVLLLRDTVREFSVCRRGRFGQQPTGT